MLRLPYIAFLVVAGTAVAQMGEQVPIGRPGASDPQDTVPGGAPPKGWGREKIGPQDTAVEATGKVVRNDGQVLLIEAEDTRILSCKLSSKTQFSGPDGKLRAEQIEPGLRVHVRATLDHEREDLTATSVVIENLSEKPKDEVTATLDRVVADDDEGRPVLRRGKPKPRPETDDSGAENAAPVTEHTRPTELASAGATAPGETKPGALIETKRPALLEKAFQVNRQFVQHLPNFVCQQLTNRYERYNKIEGWKAIDIITAGLSYIDGQEKYENIKVGSRAVHQSMMDIKGGARSQGEFGSILDGLFATDVAAEFHLLHDEFYRRLPAQVYDYAVKHETSDWTVSIGGETIHPAYSGRIWLDKQTGRVLRLERQADKIPEAFPLDLVEQTIDYDYVMIGVHKVLLPVESKNLACQRGSSYCSRNVIEWRNYQEFGAESTVDFTAK